MNKLSIASLPGLILVIMGAFLVLNYFNVISLSQLYPKYFASLPHAPFNQFKENAYNFALVSPVLQKDIISIKEASDGTLIYFLKDNVPLYPALTGSVSQGGGVYSKLKQSFNLLWITHATGQKLEYKYMGTLLGFKDKVSTQDKNPIIQLGDQKFQAIQNASLILTLYDSSGKIKKLSKSDFTTRK